MSTEPVLDEDLTAHFKWRWNEHGIYLGVCIVIGLLVLALQMVPAPRRYNPAQIDFIHVNYVAAADEPAEVLDPFHDTRLIRRPSSTGTLRGP